jgi:hypothetical protein
MQYGYLNKAVKVSEHITLNKGERVIVEVNKEPERDDAQIRFPLSHRFAGAFTIVPKKVVSLDVLAQLVIYTGASNYGGY